jgi:phosphate transport system substrate-binding protein
MYFKINRKKALVLATGCILSVALMLGGCGQGLSGTIDIGGSTTVQPLSEKWAKAFETENPDVKITIQGGGSSAGVKGCAQGIFDIGAASREIKSSETDQWPELVTVHVAADGVAVVINPASNSVADMTLEEIRAIFAGGSSATWTVINREEGSGTREVSIQW